MAEYKVSGSDLTNVADAIRTKGGTSASLAFPAGFVSAIGNIPTGGGGDDFIVNLSYDDSTDTWSPDCTFAELQAAYNAGKSIATIAHNSSTGFDCESFGYYDDEDECFYYEVVYSISSTTNEKRIHFYYFDSSGVSDDDYNDYGDLITVSPLSVTANGTYTAPSGKAYSPVTVNVPAPSVPFVTGTFTGQASEKGSAITVSIPYTGNGYPIAGIIRPSGGAWVSGGAIADLAQKSAMIIFAFQKVDESISPDYTSNNEANQMDIVAYFKYSDTDATTTSTGKGHAQRNYYNSNASSSYATCVRLKSSTSMSVYIADTSYGFKDGVEYTYVIQYSS